MIRDAAAKPSWLIRRPGPPAEAREDRHRHDTAHYRQDDEESEHTEAAEISRRWSCGC